MKIFRFKSKNRGSVSFNDNGWDYKLKVNKKIGYYFIKSPVMKEVSYSKGVNIYYKIHTFLGFGFIGRSGDFTGLALIDIHTRLLLLLIFLFGGGYAFNSLSAGLLLSLFFYFVLVVLSLSDDDLLVCKARRFYENY